MQYDCNAKQFYACSSVKERDLAEWEVTLLGTKEDGFHVDMWKPDGSNHWNIYFKTMDDAIVEYNKWAYITESWR